MNKTKIEGVVNADPGSKSGADSTQGYAWNPFVGCLNNCSYCWARKCLARSKCELCRKFTPHWHAERMDQIHRLRRPSVIAVGWMGDIWNNGWMDQGDHIVELVCGMMIAYQHTYLLLTRHPKNYNRMSFSR